MSAIQFKTRIISQSDPVIADVMCFRTDSHDDSPNVAEADAHECFLITFNLDTRALTIADHSNTFQDTTASYMSEILCTFMTEIERSENCAVPESFSLT